ncbi:flagellar hook protein FlgE [Azospira sp. I13]|uniref:flagellar hook protein FlgE n=1 Tax=Azospira sp. I13 TaxID=1765050 RepID=UPI000D475D2A|nr:flagellar hook protein FlgE [Azospira sp. I13]GBG00728.1 flagellar hook protein FlgE [Azospira sp. I13]
MAFQQGLSGLNTSAKALDVIGNNVANSSTVGFKMSDAHFADVYAASLGAGGASQVGIGTNLAGIMQQFTQGNVSTTNNTLDVAINGNGFFRLSNNGTISYSRNGQFHLDKNGYIVNDQNLRLTGYPAAGDGTIRPQNPKELQLTPDLLKLSPVATGQSKGGSILGAEVSVNLDSRVSPPTVPWDFTSMSGSKVPTISPSMYNYSTAMSIYDTLGNPHTMTLYFAKSDDPADPVGTWNMYGNVDGTEMSAAGGDVPNLETPIKVTFNSLGQMEPLTDAAATPGLTTGIQVSIDLENVATNLNRPSWGASSWGTAGASPIAPFTLNLAGTSQYGAAFSTGRLVQDGYTSGNLSGLNIGNDGVVQGRYSNGQTRNIGQMVLANFENPNGLQSIGGNQWIETSISGQPTVDAPGSGRLGQVQSNAVEESNVDLTSELVKMITQQRNYQANSQTIKTQDQIMQTIVNLR